LVQDLSISSDLYHGDELLSLQARNASKAAEAFKIPSGVITINRPEYAAKGSSGQLPYGEGIVMYRGRAAAELAGKAPHQVWDRFTKCPYEDLQPGRVHLDPWGMCMFAGNLSRQFLPEHT
jgi:hypothetical protein